jgi:serine/threonine protein phosphatase PrpC
VPSALPNFDFRVHFASATDRGGRKDNQDAVSLVPEVALFAIADGMGGHSGGGDAARAALDTLTASVRSKAVRASRRFARHPALETRHAVFGALREGFRRANDAVRALADEREEALGMGTTLDALMLVRDRAFVAHTGDSRVYLARASTFIQTTHDHALYESLLATGSVQQTSGVASPRQRGARNPLLYAVGLDKDVVVDTCFFEVARGDRILLCTDGVHGEMQSEAALSKLVRAGTVGEAAQSLVAHAVERGGRDNATAVVIEVRERLVTHAPGEEQTSGPLSTDLEVARQSALLADLPVAAVLNVLAAAVEIEIAKGERVPRVIASDWVSYLVVSGEIELPNGNVLGPPALIFPESLVGVAREGDLPTVTESTRLLRLRADDFAEVCARDVALSNALHTRLARHLARAR